jgi:drug/metabolite transporter (DMT)-like permease
MQAQAKGVAFVVIAAISYGFLPILAKLAYQAGVGVDQLLLLRFLFAWMILAAILASTGRLRVPQRRDLLLLMGLGAIGFFLQSSFYFTALLYSPVPIVALILYSYPAFVAIGSHLLGWEPISRRTGGSIVVASVGLVLVAGPTGASLGLGVLLALLAAVTYTMYILTSTGVLKRVSGETASFYVMGAACVSFGLAAAGTGSDSFGWQPIGWLWIIIIASVCTALAVTSFYLGLSRIGPSRSSLISLLEPLTAASGALVVFGQVPTLSQALGGLLILSSAIVVASSKARPGIIEAPSGELSTVPTRRTP